MSDTIFMTKPMTDAKAGSPPVPGTEKECYLLALLHSQDCLTAALDALRARMAYADADETDDIRLSIGEIQTDYLRFAAMKTAYLSKGTVYKTMSAENVENIRDILNRIQKFVAHKNKASAIVDAVTDLLVNWKKNPGRPPANANNDTDPVVTLNETI